MIATAFRWRRWDTILAAAGFAAWLSATVLSQHPDRAFDRVRDFDRNNAVIPDWRFYTGYDEAHDPEYMLVSEFVPLPALAAQAGRHR